MSNKLLPYGKQCLSDQDIQAVNEVLSSDWLTTGPKVETFEKAVAKYVGVKHAVAVSSGTAALHTALFAAGVRRGDEVVVPPMTFAATANAALYLGAKPVFADVNAETLLLEPQSVVEKITPATKVILTVDYGGQACDYEALKKITNKHNLTLIADCCHSLGGKYSGMPCGAQADLSVFSFHPVKPITTGEGGMVVTNKQALYECMQIFRNHGITTDHRQREEQGAWFYEMQCLGFNYRLSDLHCALGISQLNQLDEFILRRRAIASRYDETFSNSPMIRPLRTRQENFHGYHLYVVRVPEREKVFQQLRNQGICCNVHYIPVHLHPWYKKNLHTSEGMCPIAEAAYDEILSLPIYPSLKQSDQEWVINKLVSYTSK